jgi:hypothetical protein
MLLIELYDPRQTRVDIGGEAQKLFIRAFRKKYPEARFMSVSEKSSQDADVVFQIDGKNYNFEIKSRTGPFKSNVVYDKRITRDTQDPVLNDFAKHFSGGETKTFAELMDEHGGKFPGEGGASSGSVPKNFTTDDAEFLDTLRKHAISHFEERGDNYFAVFENGKFSIFHISGPNPLNAGPFPKFDFAKVDTYGGAYKDKMRVAVKAVVDAHSGDPVTL